MTRRFALPPIFQRETLQRHRVDPHQLLIGALRSHGCALHLDDFGSGCSAFAQLKWLELDAIKIDGTFIRKLRSNSTDRFFVTSMIGIAHDLHKTVVAEHVEDAETLDVLRSLRVDLVHGFHLSLPSALPKVAPH